MEHKLSLVRISVAGPLPRKRGWYRLDAEPIGSISGRQLFLDLGVGFNRHHSASLPANADAHFVRLTGPVRAVAVAEELTDAVASVKFSPVSFVRAFGEWLADGVAAALTALKRPTLQGRCCRPVVRWSILGLQVVPVGENRFPARTRYSLWSARYSLPTKPVDMIHGVVEIRADDVNAGDLNRLLERDEFTWIGLVRNNAALRPEALARLHRKAIATGARICYADSDQLDRHGFSYKPLLRTAFSPEWLLSDDWLGPLLLIEVAAARRVGGWSEEAGQGLHYDFCIRMLEEFGPEAFVHLPSILASEPFAAGLDQRKIDQIRGMAIDRQFLPRQAFGLPARAAPSGIAAQTTVIVPTRDRLDLLKAAIESIYQKSAFAPDEVLIVDNGSQRQETLDWLSAAPDSYPGIRVLKDPRPFNFSRLCNRAARAAQGSVLAFLNNDIEISSPLWLELCGSLALQPGVGCVGPLLTYPNGKIQHAGLVTGPGGIATHVWSGLWPTQVSNQIAPLVTRNVSGLTGACLILTKKAFELVHGFDEKHLGVAFNDLDLCLRLGERGLRHILIPWCQVIHHESSSRSPDIYDSIDGRFRAEFDWMRQSWGNVIDNDPFFPRSMRIDKSRPILFWSAD